MFLLKKNKYVLIHIPTHTFSYYYQTPHFLRTLHINFPYPFVASTEYHLSKNISNDAFYSHQDGVVVWPLFQIQLFQMTTWMLKKKICNAHVIKTKIMNTFNIISYIFLFSSILLFKETMVTHSWITIYLDHKVQENGTNLIYSKDFYSLNPNILISKIGENCVLC